MSGSARSNFTNFPILRATPREIAALVNGPNLFTSENEQFQRKDRPISLHWNGHTSKISSVHTPPRVMEATALSIAKRKRSGKNLQQRFDRYVAGLYQTTLLPIECKFQCNLF